MYKIPNRYIHYNMEGATLWLKNLANFYCSPQQLVPQPQLLTTICNKKTLC